MNQQNNDQQSERHQRQLRVSIWNFKDPLSKFKDEFLNEEDFINLTMREFESLIKTKYFNQDQDIILFHGQSLDIDNSKVSNIFNRQNVNFNSQGQILQINPYKIPLYAIPGEQIAEATPEEINYFQNQIQFIGQRRNLFYRSQNRDQQTIIQMQQDRIQKCFLINISQSMEQYKEIIQTIIGEEAMDVDNGIYSFVLFNDIKIKTDNKYQGIGFFCSIRQVYNFIENCSFLGENNLINDLHGALEQAFLYKWNRNQNTLKPKTMIIITDAPCSGRKYHKESIKDDFPNEDLNESIIKILSNQIKLKFYTFNNETDTMIEEINKIQRKLNIPKAFKHIKMNKAKDEEENQYLDTTLENSKQQNFNINLQDCRVLQQLQNIIQDKQLNQIKGLFMTHQGGKLMSYHNKYDKLEDQLKGYQDLAKIIEFNELEAIEFNSSLKPIIKQGGDQIYIIEFKKEPFLNKIYFTKTEKLRLSFKNVQKYIENHQIAKLLLKNFKEQQSIKPQHPLPDVQYTDPIVIKLNENEYMVCEQYHPYPYAQFNRLIKDEIEIQNDISDLNLYLQYFTFEGGIVLEDYNIQVINLVGFSDGKKTYLTDPHINTDDQLIQKYAKKLVGLKLPIYYSVLQ